MKRICTFLITILITVLIMTPACFASYSVDNIEIKLKINDKSMNVNNDTKDIETAPYLNNDTTMVPLRAISESIGAKVDWDDVSQVVTLALKSNEIKLTINSNKALVNKKEMELSSAPILSKEGITMVPLRFIAEGFGAKVAWFEKTDEILVVLQQIKITDADEEQVQPDTGENGQDGEDSTPPDNNNQNSIFQNITEPKIGDSYYKWTMDFPKGSIITNKEKNGTDVSMSNKNDKTSYSIMISQLSSDDVNTDIWSIIGNDGSYGMYGSKCIKQEIYEYNGQKWLRQMYYGADDSVQEIRTTVNNRYVYKLIFSAETIDSYLSLKDENLPSIILDSFKFDFNKNDKNIKDINELENGTYTYKDQNYKWSIKLPISISVPKTVSENVTMVATLGEGINVRVEFHSAKKDETLDDYVKEDINDITEGFNKDYYYVVNQSDYSFNGISAKKVLYEYVYGKDKFNSYCIYFIKDGIKYCISFNGYNKFFTDVLKASYDEILKTFKSIEPITKIKDTVITSADKIIKGNTKKYTNFAQKWSIVYPLEMTNNGSSGSSYMFGSYSGSYGYGYGYSGTVYDRFGIQQDGYSDNARFGNSNYNLNFSINTFDKVQNSAGRQEYYLDLLFKDADDTTGTTDTDYYQDEYDTKTASVLISKDKIDDKGVKITRYKYTQGNYINGSYITTHITEYIFEGKDKTYDVKIDYDDIAETSENLKILDDMWKSFTILN